METINLIFQIQLSIIALVFVYFFIHFTLIIIHKKYVMNHSNQVPIDFSEHITLKEHQKSARYVEASSDLNQSSLIFEVMVFIMFTFGGGINILNGFIESIISPGILADVLFVLIFVTIVQILQIPFGIYKTFYVEQAFGFNNQTSKDFAIDLIKSFVLTIVMVGILLLGIFYLINSLKNWWLWASIFVISFNLLISFLYPTFIAPIFNKFKPIEKGKFLTAIDELLKKCHFKNKGVFIMDGSKRSTHLNAYFTGFGSNKRIILFDTLMKKLSTNELISVLAHELGHYARKHIHKKIGFVFIQVFIAFYLLSLIQKNPLFYQAFGVNHISNGALIVLISLILPMISFFTGPISSYLSRKHEFEADEYAAKKTKAGDLISALLKLYRHNSATLTPHPWYSKFFDSHPPAKERIDQLKKIQASIDAK